jgi:hypothetical protein
MLLLVLLLVLEINLSNALCHSSASKGTVVGDISLPVAILRLQEALDLVILFSM